MKLVITEDLVRYLRNVPLSVHDMHKRGGVSEAAIYRVLRGESGFLNEYNTECLAKALGITPNELLRISCPVEKKTNNEMSIPQDLRPLLAAWPELHHNQRLQIMAYIQAILDGQKMEQKNNTNDKTD